MKTIKWGILATGNIANNFAEALNAVADAELLAVGSRTAERARGFAQKWGIPRHYASYDALVNDPDIDVIYIASPHNAHYDNMLLSLNAGKHVLCEKSLTINALQAQTCIDLAREKNLFLMEAVWMRFFPATQQVRDWVQDSIIGEIQLLQADFCIRVPFDPQHRLYDLERAGGALLDLGIYPISFASMVLGTDAIERVQSTAHLGTTGVDEWDSITFHYSDQSMASLHCGLRAYKPREAFIIGTEGYIKVHNIFFRPDTLTLHLNGKEPQTHHLPFEGNGYAHEIHEVHRCLRDGLQESPLMPLDETLAIMRVMDNLRQQWGVQYPEENHQ
ncbi:MAG: Gfo/Idh/MocA family protein [Anaerolineae bacterium]